MIFGGSFHKFLLLLLSFVVLSCTSIVRYQSGLTDTNKNSNRNFSDFSSSTKNIEKIFYGKASYYGDKFHGRKTSNGETFNQNELTAAHRFLPFNTKIKVTNIQNNKSVIVRINDRGPFVDDRILDLSKEAATQIDIIQLGVADVMVEVID